MVFLDGATASEKSDEKNDASNHNKEHWGVEKAIA